jgi:hypothetical protein
MHQGPCLIQTTKKSAKRTVPARMLCIHASWALGARYFSWHFIEPGCITHQPAQADVGLRAQSKEGLRLMYGICQQCLFKSSHHCSHRSLSCQNLLMTTSRSHFVCQSPQIPAADRVLQNSTVSCGKIWLRTGVDHTLESGVCLGVQRIRCYPFSCDKAWRRNPMQYVAVIPPKKYTDIPFARFNMANEAHRRKLWYGRAELFFRCAFQDSNKRKKFEVDLVLASCLYDFKCPDAQTILKTKGGASMFYKPDKEWLIVLPINHILGRVPLMKAYLSGSMSPTIPA